MTASMMLMHRTLPRREQYPLPPRIITERIADEAGVRDDMGKRFNQVERRFDSVDERFDRVNDRFKGVDQRFDQVASRFDRLEQLIKER